MFRLRLSACLSVHALTFIHIFDCHEIYILVSFFWFCLMNLLMHEKAYRQLFLLITYTQKKFFSFKIILHLLHILIFDIIFDIIFNIFIYFDLYIFLKASRRNLHHLETPNLRLYH